MRRAGYQVAASVNRHIADGKGEADGATLSLNGHRVPLTSGVVLEYPVCSTA
jgi:hypothetical protein